MSLDTQLVKKEIERVWPWLPPNPVICTKLAGRLIARTFSSIEGLANYVLRTAGPGVDHYVHINEVVSGDRKANIDDVRRWCYIFIDIDPVDLEADPDAARAETLQVLYRLDPGYFTAALGIDSGRGSQIWLRVNDPGQLQPRDVESAMGAFLRTLPPSHGCRIDPCTSDLPRIARLPGSINSKTGRFARVIFEATGVLEGDEFVSRWRVPSAAPAEPMQLSLDGTWSLTKALGRVTSKAGEFLCYGWDSPGRRAAVVATAASLVEIGVPRDVAYTWVCNGNTISRPKPLSRLDFDRAFNNGWERGARNAAARKDQA